MSRLNSSTLREFVDVKTSAMILRIFTAAFMIYGHGFGKLVSVFSGNLQFMDPIGLGPELSLILAALAEGLFAFFILIGFWTRLSALILTFNMAVAVFLVHLPGGDWFNDMELPLIYLVLFIVIFLLGPGKFSVDEAQGR